MSSWQNFARKPVDGSPAAVAAAAKPKEKPVAKAKPALFFRPPKHKPETR